MSHSPSAGADQAGSWNDSAQQDSDTPGLRRLQGDQVERGRSAAPAWAPHGSRHSPAASNDGAAAGSGGLPDQQQHQRGNSLGAAAQRPEPPPNRRWKLPSINRAGNDSAAFPPRPADARHDTAAQSAATAGGPLGAPSYASDPAVQRMLLDMQRQLRASDQRKRRRNRKAIPRPAAGSRPSAVVPAAASKDAKARQQRKRQAASQATPKRHKRISTSSDCADICGGGSAAQPASTAAASTAAGPDKLRPNGTAVHQRLKQPAPPSQQPPGFQQRLPPDLRDSAHAAQWAECIEDYRQRRANGTVKPAVTHTHAAPPAAADGPAESAAVASAVAAGAAAAHRTAVSDPGGTLSSLAQQWHSPLLLRPTLAAPMPGVEQRRQPMHLVCPPSALLAAAISGAQAPASQLPQPPAALPASAGNAAGAATAGGLLQQHQAAVAAAVSAAMESAAAAAAHRQPPPLSLAAVLAEAAASARMPAASLCDTLQRLSSSHLSASSSGSGHWQPAPALADRTPGHPAAAATAAAAAQAPVPTLSWPAKRQRTGGGRKQRSPPASGPAATPNGTVAMPPSSRKQFAATAGGRFAARPFVWREPRRLGKRGWARLLRASLVALPLRLLLDLVVWQPQAAMASSRCLALLTSFPCPAAVPPGLGVGILTLAEFSLRVAPGRLWEH